MDKELQEHLNREFKAAIIALEKHAQTSNEEVGTIQKDISVVKNDVNWFKEKIEKFDIRLDKFESKVWWIISIVVLSGIGQIIATIATK